MKFRHLRPPPPLRPGLVITLAPLCLFGLAAQGLDLDGAGLPLVFDLFYGLAGAVALGLLAAARWLAAGGWAPSWGAFTFPASTFVNLQLAALDRGYGLIAQVGLVAGLAMATPLIFYVVYRASLAWVRGDLARLAGAATA